MKPVREKDEEEMQREEREEQRRRGGDSPWDLWDESEDPDRRRDPLRSPLVPEE